jgi:hypothetical protein
VDLLLTEPSQVSRSSGEGGKLWLVDLRKTRRGQVCFDLSRVMIDQILRGQANQVARLLFTSGSFVQIVDGLGYTFMGVALFFAAPSFAGKRLDNWIRWLCLLSGPGALLVFLSYVFYITSLGVAEWIITPALAILLAVYFRKADITLQDRSVISGKRLGYLIFAQISDMVIETR